MTQTQINWRNPFQKISKYFSVGEVTKGDARRIPPTGDDIEREILKLAIKLDQIREEWGLQLSLLPGIAPPKLTAPWVGRLILSTFTEGRPIFAPLIPSLWLSFKPGSINTGSER